ncbi:MAG: HAMP domain-containing protein [Proteobacteria bacterium]|nr:HAMP domain-containing protein [Pseudomonadota bacterium]
MRNYTLYRFKTLQGRLAVMLLLPIFLIIFSGGVITFLYTGNFLINQWNESAVLKLQRASHDMGMRLSKPIELIETLFKISNQKNDPLYPKSIVEYLNSLEGVTQATFIDTQKNGENTFAQTSAMGMKHHGMMQVYGTKLSKISDPEYNADQGHETVTLFFSLFDSNEKAVGNLEVKMSFNYLLKDIIRLGWWQSDMACIVDQNGKYMAHTNMTMKDRHYLGGENDPLEIEILEQMKTNPSGTVKSSGYPPNLVAGFYKLEQVPWTIILFAQGKIILKSITAYRTAFALSSFVLVFIILMLIKIHVGKITNMIKLLSKNAQNVAKGEYGKAIEVQSQDEIGQLVHSYNTMVEGLEERDFIRDSFGRYVDPDFAKHLLKHPDAGKLGGKRREVAIMMSDIRGFTTLSETLSPEIIVSILNQYFSHMIAIIQKYNGIIVDFFGDSILVFFEPLSSSLEDTVLNCIQCASDMQYQMHEFNRKMNEKTLPELAMGIGINAGQVVVGNIGSETRAKYGIVGSAVNIMSRIQAKAKKQEIVITDAVYKYVKKGIEVERSFNANLKGVDYSIMLHIIKHN